MMSWADMDALVGALAPEVKRYVAEQTAPLLTRIAELEAANKAVSTLHFHGVHQRAVTYPRGAAVTNAGALWVAVKDVAPGEVPGASEAWQLAVKAGAAK
jgi:hypothetical protein